MDKEKWISITDEAEADVLVAARGELDTPTLYAPNGQLWAIADEMRLWRAGREPHRS